MHQQYSRPSRSGSRKGGRVSHSHSRAGGRGGYAGSRSRFPARRSRQQGQTIDAARFINKAVVTEVQEQFVPEHRFQDFAVSDRLKDNITTKGYEIPTPIQDKAIPHVLAGSDIVGIANTGTGKTAAFLIPLIEKVLKDRSERVLIMVPTRELATQIEEEFWGFASHMKIGAVTVVGGANINPQLRDLRRAPNFVIGTPGRLKDVIERRVLDLSKFGTVVLDEADRMLDMGFINDMKYLLALMPEKRHTLFFSATLSREIEQLIGSFLRNPISISVKTRDTASGVDQDVVRPNGKHKFEMLCDMLLQPEYTKVLVFGRTKHGVEKLAKALTQRGFKAESIHGNKTQAKRERALKAFKDHRVQILAATDVAARGIDVADVTHVINYDQPATYDDYVHRIGRTGRAGKGGKALTFVD
jgi:superfamily II DNA/RNA helicase